VSEGGGEICRYFVFHLWIKYCHVATSYTLICSSTPTSAAPTSAAPTSAAPTSAASRLLSPPPRPPLASCRPPNRTYYISVIFRVSKESVSSIQTAIWSLWRFHKRMNCSATVVFSVSSLIHTYIAIIIFFCKWNAIPASILLDGQ